MASMSIQESEMRRGRRRRRGGEEEDEMDDGEGGEDEDERDDGEGGDEGKERDKGDEGEEKDKRDKDGDDEMNAISFDYTVMTHNPRESFAVCGDENPNNISQHPTHKTVELKCGKLSSKCDSTVILSPFSQSCVQKTGSRKRKTELNPDDEKEHILIARSRVSNIPHNFSANENELLLRIANLEREKRDAEIAIAQKDREIRSMKESEQKVIRIYKAKCDQFEECKKENEALVLDNRKLREKLESIETQLGELIVKWEESQNRRHFLEHLVDKMKEGEDRLTMMMEFECGNIAKEREQIDKREREVRERESTVKKEKGRVKKMRELIRNEHANLDRFAIELQKGIEERSGTKVITVTEMKKAKGMEMGNGILRSRVQFSLLKIDQRTNRLKQLHDTVIEICGPCLNPDRVAAEVATVIHAYMKKYGVDPVLNDGKFTAIKDLEMSLATHLSQNQRNQLKTFLFKSGIDVLAPTNHLRKLREYIKSHYQYTYNEKEIATMKEGKKQVSLLELSDVRKAVKFRLENLIASGQLDSTKRSFDVCISGDSGKSSTKLVLMIGGVNKTNDVQNLILLAKYDGDDSSEMIRSLLGDVINQVNAMKNIEIDIDGNTVSVELVQYLTGDFKFLWAVLGMGAATSRYNCIWCWRENKYKMSDDEPVAEARTLDGMREKAKLKERCMNDEPLFETPPERIIPGTLHTLTGVAIRLAIVPLQVMAKNDDLTAAGLNIIDFNQITDFNDTVAGDSIVIPRGRGRMSENGSTKVEKALKQKKEEQKSSRQRRKNCDTETRNGTMLAKLISVVSVEQRIDLADDAEPCARKQYCLSRDKTFDKLDAHLCSTQVGCDICRRWYHYACEGRFSFSESNYCSARSNKYVCLDCSANRQVQGKARLEEVKKKLKEIEETKVEIDKEIEERQAMIDSLFLISDGKGKVSLALVAALKLIGADLRTWGQCLTGNHIRKCLKDESIEILCSVVSSSAHTPNHKKIMHCLKVIQSLTISRPLFNYEMIFLRNTIKELERLAGLVYPNVNRFPKAHALFAHVIDFAKRYGQWGLFTDQPTEKLHQFLNYKDRQYNNIRRKDARWLAQAYDLAYTNYVHDIKPPTSFDPYTPKLRGSYKKKTATATVAAAAATININIPQKP